MAAENNNRTWILLSVVVGIWLVVCVLMAFIWGFRVGFWAFMFGIVLFALIALITLAIFWLFQVRQTDMIAEMKKSIVKTCRLNIPNHLQYVYMWGDPNNNVPSRLIGVGQGFCELRSKPIYKEDKVQLDDGTVKVEKIKISDPKKLVIVAFNEGKSFPFSLFDDMKLFIGFTDDIRGTLDDSNIYLNGVLSPEIFGFITLAKHWQTSEVLDETASSTVFRYEMQHLLSDIKNLVDDSIAISPEHKKRMEKSNMEMVTGSNEQEKSK